jgi:hypothetical protein
MIDAMGKDLNLPPNLQGLPDPLKDSLFRRGNSLFGSKNSLFGCVGNLLKKPNETRWLQRHSGAENAQNRENSLYFP